MSNSSKVPPPSVASKLELGYVFTKVCKLTRNWAYEYQNAWLGRRWNVQHSRTVRLLFSWQFFTANEKQFENLYSMASSRPYQNPRIAISIVQSFRLLAQFLSDTSNITSIFRLNTPLHITLQRLKRRTNILQRCSLRSTSHSIAEHVNPSIALPCQIYNRILLRGRKDTEIRAGQYRSGQWSAGTLVR
jgi:hypothetical protein